VWSSRFAVGLALAGIGAVATIDLRLYTALITLIALLALHEIDLLLKRADVSFVAPVAYVATVAYLILASGGWLTQHESLLIALLLLAAFAGAVRGRAALTRVGLTVVAVLYIGKLFAYFLVLRRQPSIGWALNATVILIIIATDTAAMLIGRRWGRRRLTAISPQKTVEGALGALLVATLFGVASINALGLGWPWWQSAALAAGTSLAAQAGDLVESAIKRDAGVKDTGRLLASHGGVLDRFDSYLFGGFAFTLGLTILGRLPEGALW